MGTANQVASWLDAMPSRVARDVGIAVVNGAEILKSQIQANASGRPGPNAPTGDYRRSWQVQPIGGKLAAVVSTNRPQAMRLEFGFVGDDSLGRTYNQPAFPHIEPAILKMRPRIEKMVTTAAITAARRS